MENVENVEGVTKTLSKLRQKVRVMIEGGFSHLLYSHMLANHVLDFKLKLKGQYFFAKYKTKGGINQQCFNALREY